jgi:hypothetical protein
MPFSPYGQKAAVDFELTAEKPDMMTKGAGPPEFSK